MQVHTTCCNISQTTFLGSTTFCKFLKLFQSRQVPTPRPFLPFLFCMCCMVFFFGLSTSPSPPFPHYLQLLSRFIEVAGDDNNNNNNKTMTLKSLRTLHDQLHTLARDLSFVISPQHNELVVKRTLARLLTQNKTRGITSQRKTPASPPTIHPYCEHH